MAPRRTSRGTSTRQNSSPHRSKSHRPSSTSKCWKRRDGPRKRMNAGPAWRLSSDEPRPSASRWGWVRRRLLVGASNKLRDGPLSHRRCTKVVWSAFFAEVSFPFFSSFAAPEQVISLTVETSEISTRRRFENGTNGFVQEGVCTGSLTARCGCVQRVRQQQQQRIGAVSDRHDVRKLHALCLLHEQPMPVQVEQRQGICLRWNKLRFCSKLCGQLVPLPIAGRWWW